MSAVFFPARFSQWSRTTAGGILRFSIYETPIPTPQKSRPVISHSIIETPETKMQFNAIYTDNWMAVDRDVNRIRDRHV